MNGIQQYSEKTDPQKAERNELYPTREPPPSNICSRMIWPTKLLPYSLAQYFSNQNEMHEAGFTKYICSLKQFVPYSKRNRPMKTKK